MKLLADLESIKSKNETLSQEVDDLLSDIAKFEQKMKNENNEENKK